MYRFDLPLADPSAAAALASAARRSRRFLISRRMFRASVTDHSVAASTYERVLFTVERRQLATEMVPDGIGSVRALPDPHGVDPWSVNPDTLEDDSRVVAACPPCAGAGEVTCRACRGTLWASCGHCVGGKVFAQRKGRLFKNCPHCRGRGTQKCTSCRSGTVGCSHCGASGRGTAWLTLAQETRTQVVAHPRNAAARIHRRLADPADFDAGTWPARLSADTGPQSNLALPAELRPTVDLHSERVVCSCRRRAAPSPRPRAEARGRRRPRHEAAY